MMAQLNLFATKYTGHEPVIDWDSLSGFDLADACISNSLLWSRYLKEEQPRMERQMRRWADQIRRRQRVNDSGIDTSPGNE